MIKRQGNNTLAVDEEPHTVIDKTTNTAYIYVSETLDPALSESNPTGWRCYRITVANATVKWANGSSAFNKQASLAATYTY